MIAATITGHYRVQLTRFEQRGFIDERFVDYLRVEIARDQEWDGLSPRVFNVLKRAGVQRVDAARQLSDEDLLEIRLLGRVGLAELRTFLETPR